MPRKAPTICRAPGCGQLVHGGSYCGQHVERAKQSLAESHRSYNQRRPDSDQRYKTTRWRKLSIAFRRKHPLCCECEAQGLVRVADLVDHIEPAKEKPELFFEWRNLRALCHRCHNRIGRKVRA